MIELFAGIQCMLGCMLEVSGCLSRLLHEGFRVPYCTLNMCVFGKARVCVLVLDPLYH